MRQYITALLLLALYCLPLVAQEANDEVGKQAASLEAELGKFKDTSPAAADAMAQLVDLYHQDGRLFGLVRIGQQFVTTHPTDKRHKAIMLKLIDGQEALSRNKELTTTIRQFAARYPDAAELPALEVRLADAHMQMEDKARTAEACRAVWKRQGANEIGRRYGVAAMYYFGSLNNESILQAAQLGEEMVDKLPAGEFARQVGWHAFNDYRRVGQWAKSTALGTKLFQKNLTGSPESQRQLHLWMAENHGNLGQHANAAQSLKQARAIRDDQPTHYQMIYRLAHAGTKPAELEPAVKEYGNKYPERQDRYTGISYLAMSNIANGDKPRGVQLLTALLVFDPATNNNAAVFVRENGNEPPQLADSEDRLVKAIAQNKPGVFYLRYVLAFELYRDRMKDNAKAKAVLRDLITQSPSDDGHTTGAVDWLLYNSADENEFRSDLQLVLEARKKHPHIATLRDSVKTWSTNARQNKDFAAKANIASEELKKASNDGLLNAFAEQKNNQHPPGEAIRDGLLKSPTFESLSEASARYVLQTQAEWFRHYAPGNKRGELLRVYKQFAQKFPKDYGVAVAWLEAATDYGKPEDAPPAAENLLKFEPENASSDTWRRLFMAADRKKNDAQFTKAAYDWMQKAQKKFGLGDSNYAAGIGDALVKAGMEKEAVEHWTTCLTANPQSSESRECAQRLLGRLTEPAKRILFIQELIKPDTDLFGRYSQWLADEYLKAGDVANVERVLKETKTRVAERPLRSSDFEPHSLSSWLDAIRSHAKLTPEEKNRLYVALRDLGVQPAAVGANLLLLENTPVDPKAKMVRLLDLQRATRTVGNEWFDWDRLLPFAQASIGKKDYVSASVLATGMLSNISNIDDARKKVVRDLVTQSLSRMGGVGLTIDDSSPPAPLLQAAMYFRLGDERLAYDTYLANKKLFHENRNQLPPDLLMFVCERLMSSGEEADHDYVEEVLRGWLVQFSENMQQDDATKARMQLLLAKNFFKAKRYDVARAEYTTVVNRYAHSPQAIEAEFGIGETYLAQRVFDQAELVFEKLARHTEIDVVVRAEFLRGVLAFRRGERDEARDIFRAVLERVPNVELANQALFNLAEVYGAEERYIDQLNLLRTVGRLGRASKRRHVPGLPLSIVVHDSDLGISRGHNRIPVRVTTQPGGDSETIYLVGSGAGKGLFRADLETRLGQATANDHVLQLTGKDVIKCDYPNEFKAEFKNVPLSDVEIRVAADAKFEIASSKIEDVKQETLSQELERERKTNKEDQRVSQTRPANQIKPGNPIYLRVKDGDRDLSGDVDQVIVKLTADSGDQIQVPLLETGPHTGIFEGSAKTGDLPAGALASDTGIDHSPLMAIDRDPKSFWMSEPDGAAPKWLAVDMKDLREVAKVKITTPDAEKYAPVRGELLGSQDGEFWFRLASQPARAPALALPGEYKQMTRRVYNGNHADITTWDQVVALNKNTKPVEEAAVENLRYERAADSQDVSKPFTVMWQGQLVQAQSGAVRISIQGVKTALLVDGVLELPVGAGGRSADVWLEAGSHQIAIFAATNNPKQVLEALIARASLTTEKVPLRPFRPADFDLTQPIAKKTAAEPQPATVSIQPDKTAWEFAFPSHELRYVKFVCQEYFGEAVAVSNVEISGEKTNELYIPTKEDVLALAANDTLEIAGGDNVLASYTDEITLNDTAGSQLLTGKLQATYFNANIGAIGYEFGKQEGGAVVTNRKLLKRIDPGERIVVEITDYDEDSSPKRDTVPFQVQVNEGPFVDFVATETQDYSGIFSKEVDTAPEDTKDRLTVKPGDRVLIRYHDTHNTFPGHSVKREEVVFVPQPTLAQVRVMETRVVPPAAGNKSERKGPPQIIVLPKREQKISGVAFEAPITIEVIDPDAAKDSRSTALVLLQTTDGAKVEVECQISAKYSDIATELAEREALAEGRFVGQVILQLGGKNSPAVIPLTTEMTRDLAGKVRLGEEATGDAANANLVTRVLNLTGKDVVTASYTDVRRPANAPEQATAQGRLISNGKLQVTDRDYEKDVTQLHVGERLYLKVIDADFDTSDARDFVAVEVSTQLGEKETVKLEETLTHSGIFTGSLQLKAVEKPTAGNLNASDPIIESYFGDNVTVKFVDSAASTETGTLEQTIEIPVVIGTDGLVAAFSKTFQDENLAVETRFRIAESYFELFKSHKQLAREEEKKLDLEAGRRVLREVMEDYPDPKYAPRIAYLLGQFAQELEQWDEAIKSYDLILRQYAEHSLAPDAQYKLAQCYEQAGDFDQALEAYVTLAATHPKSPLIPNVMIRISDHFYKTEKYEVAAQVGEKFIERFESHSNAPRMAFRIGQCYYKAEKFQKAGKSFDKFSEVFPKDTLSADAFFWAGESYRMASQARLAFISYNNCRWKHPDSEAAKYARGRLALPEMLQQFEAEANSVDENK